MGWIMEVLKRLRRPASADDEVRRELRAHLELEVDELVAEGKTPDEARTLAHRTVGNEALIREQVRELSPWALWEQLWQDVRYALRTLGRTPVFTTTAILTIALGVGANSAIFSVIDALALKPLPVAGADTLVVVRELVDGNLSYPDYVTLRDGNRTLSGLAAASALLKATVAADAESEPAAVRIVSANYFSVLGVHPAIGRLLVPDDDNSAVAVMSHGYWTRRFRRSADVIGRVLKLRGVSLTIVGVAPEGFFGETPGEAPDLWASMAMQRPAMLHERGFSWLYLMGRLKPGVSVAQAQADLSARVAEPSPRSAQGANARLAVAPGMHGVSRWRDRVGTPLWILMALALLVLLIACTNLAGLLLTRGAARQVEIAMRLAIGASCGRLLRQLMTEALLLSAIGGAIGLAFAVAGGRLLVRMASAVGTGPDLALPLDIDGRLLVFTGIVSMVTGALFGTAPALRGIRAASRHVPGSSRSVVDGERARGLRGVLMAIQVALSLVLVACSMLFVRTVRNLELQPLGFRADGLLRVEIETDRGYKPDAALVSHLLARVAALQGVEAATGVAGGTLGNIGGATGLQFEGFAPRSDQDRRARADWVGPDYFRVAGMPLVAGRDFSTADREQTAPVTVVNQAVARYYFGSDSAALGRRVTWNRREYEIVGVAEDAKYAGLRERTLRMIYFPALQTGIGINALEVRTAGGNARELAAAVRAAVRDVDPRLHVGEMLTGTERVNRSLGRELLVARLSSFFGVLTLLLVSIGIYGIVAYSAGRRARELAVRLALGARRGGVIWLVLRDIATAVAIGAAVGLAGALGVGRLVRTLLFGLEPTDLLTFAAAAGLLLGVAFVAALLPALRASRLDPAAVLRE